MGIIAATIAFAVNPTDARASADQNWSPFVLVAGLLLIGLVADDDGLFAAAGHQLARTLRNGVVLYIGAVVTIGIVTALLNLDTSVAFLTPVLIYTARSRGEGEAPLLYGCLLLSNAGSLFLPGSNLTNLIVLGHLHLSGGQFFGHMWLAALAALIATAAAIAIVERRSLHAAARRRSETPTSCLRCRTGCRQHRDGSRGAAPSPAPFVAVVGVVAIGIRLAQRQGPRGARGVRARRSSSRRPVRSRHRARRAAAAWSGPASTAVAPRSMGNRRRRGRCVCALQQLARRDRFSPR